MRESFRLREKECQAGQGLKETCRVVDREEKGDEEDDRPRENSKRERVRRKP